MRKIKRSIILILIVLLNLVITPSLDAETHFKNISTIGSAKTSLRPDQAIIRLKISGEGSNQSRLNYQFREEIKRAIRVLNNTFSNKLDIIEGDIEIVSYLEENNHFPNELYKVTSYLKFKVDNSPIENITKLIDTIKELNPANKNVTYNQSNDISYKIDRAYYTFKNPLQHQQKLLKDAFNNSKTKVTSLLDLSSLKLIGIYQLKEITPSNISIYQEEIDINNIRQATEKSFQTELRVLYQVN
ncbi:hypothetical protein U472_08770 [Orenia metallireducens]|uniref:SIMPL domain-containing protein n=1 Tax=Orenia metallireducens TaxID=1413210 RepID=A0A1C0A7A4_9FIRM|nr:SIMPL domain-containing protein [Orenia metallireducens]OCL26098.1 hypothetical protein U472_08770 [Orenia metallireducens]